MVGVLILDVLVRSGRIDDAAALLLFERHDSRRRLEAARVLIVVALLEDIIMDQGCRLE